MDALSEALRSMRITGALFFNAELTAPWGFASPPSSSAHQILAPGTEHLVLFHLVTEGQATVRIDGHDDVTLEAGDIVVLPHGDAHVQVSRPRPSEDERRMADESVRATMDHPPRPRCDA